MIFSTTSLNGILVLIAGTAIISSFALYFIEKPAFYKAGDVMTDKNISANLFKITIDRKIQGASCSQGYILVNNTVIAYTLELIEINNKNYISSIPKDTYSAFIRTDGRKGWRIELKDVPNRQNVQIHIGNFTSQIEGCILIGTIVDIDHCTVLNNYKHEAMKKLEDKFNQFTRDLILNQINTNTIEIQVEITGI
jgi:hypothetical protein